MLKVLNASGTGVVVPQLINGLSGQCFPCVVGVVHCVLDVKESLNSSVVLSLDILQECGSNLVTVSVILAGLIGR